MPVGKRLLMLTNPPLSSWSANLKTPSSRSAFQQWIETVGAGLKQWVFFRFLLPHSSCAHWMDSFGLPAVPAGSPAQAWARWCVCRWPLSSRAACWSWRRSSWLRRRGTSAAWSPTNPSCQVRHQTGGAAVQVPGVWRCDWSALTRRPAWWPADQAPGEVFGADGAPAGQTGRIRIQTEIWGLLEEVWGTPEPGFTPAGPFFFFYNLTGCLMHLTGTNRCVQRPGLTGPGCLQTGWKCSFNIWATCPTSTKWAGEDTAAATQQTHVRWRVHGCVSSSTAPRYSSATPGRCMQQRMRSRNANTSWVSVNPFDW